MIPNTHPLYSSTVPSSQNLKVNAQFSVITRNYIAKVAGVLVCRIENTPHSPSLLCSSAKIRKGKRFIPFGYRTPSSLAEMKDHPLVNNTLVKDGCLA